MQQGKVQVRALFVSSQLVYDGKLTRVSLFLLPGQSPAFQSMLEHCPDSISSQTGLCTVSRWNKRLEQQLSTLDEVELMCLEKSSSNGKTHINFEAVLCVRQRHEVLGDQELRQRLAADGHFLVSSTEGEWVDLTSNTTSNTRVQVTIAREGEPRLDVRLWTQHAEQLHAALAKDVGMWKRFMTVHKMPFVALVSTNVGKGFLDTRIVHWDIASYLDQHGVPLSPGSVVDRPNVFFPTAEPQGEDALVALVCPAEIKTEEELLAASKDGKLECCAVFLVPNGKSKKQKK
jgi:hypothetical protein